MDTLKARFHSSILAFRLQLTPQMPELKWQELSFKSQLQE
jgi:hypothetical protein